jgi:hypothetical protein
VAAGSFANASSVGANTVNGPAPFSVETRSAAVSAFASVVNMPAPPAVSTMSLSWARVWPASGPSVSSSATAVIAYVLNISCAPCQPARLPRRDRPEGRVELNLMHIYFL